MKGKKTQKNKDVEERLLWIEERLEDLQDTQAEIEKLLTNHLTEYSAKIDSIHERLKDTQQHFSDLSRNLWIVLASLVGLATAVMIKFIMGS
jgi:predicted nuclease with TOPRIM domain